MKDKNKRKGWKILLYILLAIFIIWFIFVVFEYCRVKSNKQPLICLNYHESIGDSDEFAYECYGLLYKYKEYYYKVDKTMSAREFTMFFTEFKRKN